MNTKEQFVITISREVGSGGRTIGSKLAERLGVRYCDKQLIKSLMEKFGISAGSIEKIKGQKKNTILEALRSFTPDPYSGPVIMSGREYNPGITTDDVFNVETEVLRQLASEGSCVIAGRSGFFILKDCPNKFDIFIRASLPKRIERVMTRQGVSREEAANIIETVDKARENYIKRFTGISRYDARNYDLVLNVDDITPDEAVDVIMKFIEASSK